RQAASPGYKSIWHWLIKHPVEFSKNNHTPSGTPHQQDPVRGNLSNLLGAILAVNLVFEAINLVRPDPRSRSP
ncbi:hypothetical protein, partial [Micromonospora chersina]|uniref:hypothetical protein n=1 Tax=Micromonospora chersina TaxID=47854 RepID=UPI0033C77B5E